MTNLKLNLEYTGIQEKEIMTYAKQVEQIHKDLHSRAKEKKDFVGWIELPTNYNKKEFERIKKAAEKIKSDSDVLIVIGIGGSYLGARAVIESLSSPFEMMKGKKDKKSVQVIYAGNNLNPTYINDVINSLEGRDFSINVISKSGTTTEPAIAFRIFREILENKYDLKEARKRIYVTTDEKRGALKTLADEEGYESFVIPDHVGGRYSVLTAVGLLPIAAAGIDIDALMKGAKFAQDKYSDANLKYNDCYKYAVTRNLLYQDQKNIELFVSYDPRMHYFIEWWKQLFGESEGKDKKGIFPTGAEFTTDLHSLGQYIQDGRRNLMETVLHIKKNQVDLKIKHDDDNLDGLNYLEGKTIGYVNQKAMEGTIKAHVSGGVPNFVIEMDKLDEAGIGHLIYFFELACAVSGNILGVDPFNQPGVETYKTNMFELLEKPGYGKEAKTKETEKKKTATKKVSTKKKTTRTQKKK